MKQLRGVSALLEMLQENELLELSLSLVVSQSLGCLPRDLKVFSVMLARRSSSISHVAEQGLHHRAASCYRTMGDSFPCMAESWPTARKKSKQEETQYLLIYCLECSNPEMISGSF